MTGPSTTITHSTRQFDHDYTTEVKHSKGITHHTHQFGQACRQAITRIRHCFTSYVSPLGWAAAGCGTACLCAFPLLGWIELLTFGIAATSMTFCAILLALGNTKFDASIHVPQRRITVGGTTSITVNISNTGTVPTTNTPGGLPIGNGHRRFGIPRLLPKQTKQISMELHAPSRAILTIGPLRIRKGDPFGLTRHENDLAERINVYVHPKIVRLPLLHAGIPRDLEGQSSRRIADDDIDFYGLREYEPGDDIRHVHWPSCAKADSLMIRQYEATCRTDTSLTLSTNESDYASREEFEMAVSAHASIGVQCLLQYRLLYVHAGETHTQPRNTMSFLDDTSAITLQQDSTISLADGILRHTPNASLYVITVGSKKTLNHITRAAMALPQSVRRIVLQTDIGANRSIRQCADCTVITIGELNDLPLVLGALP